ncbi:GNAT family N-acetyltransferase [Kitasatospora sp. MAP5-34]|uniref:GNAT family N-acetyltransferase n=1 Tax=Kitasatospora sp. MAP5-34 TaxID=3035102 RepID=UPI002474D043|nr:GNAT family N-acetyltransferase [Kitasatospora sp. MAP5-34]MDH6576669.1 ribosomal protein S18 acetylase RimI-like enzyme [Kitasatospora sp. MAP5-34]
MTRQIVIRTGAAADAETVAALYAESRQAAYAGILPPEVLGDGLAEVSGEIWAIRLTADYGEPADTPVLLIAEAGGELYGFAYLVPEPDGRVLLDNLHVRPGHTGAGLGRRLLREALALARNRESALYLEVLAGNTRAVAFYEREGGVRTDERDCEFAAGFTLPEYEYTWLPDAAA